MQTFRSTVNSRGETSRATSDDSQVVKIGLGPRSQANFLRDIRRNALEKLRAIGKQHYREIRAFWPKCFQKAFGFRIIGRKLNIDPLIGHMIAREKIAQLITLG